MAVCRITAVINQKGGVGKTSTAYALSAGLRLKGYKVLSVDCDPQSNLSYGMQADLKKNGLYEAMASDIPITETIQTTAQGEIISSSLKLSSADIIFVDIGKEYLLSSALEAVKDKYDYIIIDCPPQLGILSVNALVAATDVIIALTADLFSLQGLSQLSETIGKINKYYHKNVSIAGLLLCKHNSRSVLSRDFKDIIENKATELETKLYKTNIREGVAIREAQAKKINIFEYDPQSNPAVDYNKFITEYLNDYDGGKINAK